MTTARAAIGISTMVYDGQRWTGFGTVVGTDRKTVLEFVLSKLVKPEIATFMRSRLGAFIECTEDPDEMGWKSDLMDLNECRVILMFHYNNVSIVT